MNEASSQSAPGGDDGSGAPVASTEAQRVENPFSCNICKRSYTRVDHLSRHYRSHTREKPFVCDICNKDFARVDLLKRHIAAHNGERPSKRQKTPRKTAHSRVSQACIACAEVKLRCEGTEPCGRCQSKGLLCEYSRPRLEKVTYVEPRQASEAASTSLSEAPLEHDSHSTQQPADLARNTFEMEVNQDDGRAPSWDQNVLEQPQLPTPTTFDQNSTILPLGTMNYDVDPGMTFDDLPLLDFLKEVMASPQTHNDMRQNLSDGMQQHYQRDLLDFNIDSTFDYPGNYSLPGLDPLEQQPMTFPISRGGEDTSGLRSGMTTPGAIHRSIGIGTKAFRESIWLWTPAQEDHGFAEQSNLSLPHGSVVSPNDATTTSYPREQLMQAPRDRILASVLGTCDAVNVPRVVACFPSAELLTILLHNFLEFHLLQDMCFIHPATLNINEESAEFLGCLISSGAVLSPVPELRKLGFALQEAMRLSIPELFEHDNRNTRRLRPLQSYALQLDVGLWSGDRRKMEIAQSFGLPLVTMVRKGGHFRKSQLSDRTVQHDDDEKMVESKWRAWVEAESFKRLALFLFSRDTRTSMSLLDQPLVSYAEISADLPYSRDLWLAKTAQEWKSIYLARCPPDFRNHLPSIRTCIDDASPIFKYPHIIDVDMALIIVLSSIWSLIWQYREMKMIAKSVTKGGFRTNGPTANSLKQEISQLMQHLNLNATEWNEGMKPGSKLMYEQCLMHLHVSLDDVQLLAGKEGEDEARKVFPILTAWAESSESRQAVFHAGQVFKAAKQYKNHMLRDAPAVAVYHAGLAFWAYSVASKNLGSYEEELNQHSSRRFTGQVGGQKFVRLDGEESPELQRFLVLGKGIPSIQRWSGSDDSSIQADIPLSDPMNVMNAMTSLLWNKNGADEKSCPPLVVNLSKLMRSLGNIAAGMRRR